MISKIYKGYEINYFEDKDDPSEFCWYVKDADGNKHYPAMNCVKQVHCHKYISALNTYYGCQKYIDWMIINKKNNERN